MGYFFIGEGIMLLSVFIVTFLMMRFLDRRPFSDLGFSLKGRGKDILYGFLMAVLIYAIGFGVCLLTGQIEVVSVHLHWSDLLLSGLFFAMVAIVEETMMRGYVLGRLLRTRLNKFISLLISSLLFALLHLMNPNVAFLPMLNLVFSLRLPANNLINGGAFGFEGSLVCTVLATLFTLFIIWWFEQ